MKIDGLEVVDAKKPLTLHITRKHTVVGDAQDPRACAAARCILEMPGVKAAKVHIARTYLQKGNKWYRYDTPNPLRDEIISFDRAKIFEPGDYELEPIRESEIAQRGKAHTLGGPNHGRPGHKRAKPHYLAGVRTHALCGVRSKGKNKVHSH